MNTKGHESKGRDPVNGCFRQPQLREHDADESGAEATAVQTLARLPDVHDPREASGLRWL